MNNRALAFIDLETTGLKPTSEIIEMAVIKVDPEKLSIIEEWSIKIKPEDIKSANPESLRVNGYNEKEWEDAVDIRVGLTIFNEKVKDCILVGHNIAWDLLWIQNAFQSHGISKSFYYQALDTISLAYAKLYHKIKSGEISFLGLDVLVNYCGVRWESRHRALEDARATYQVFVKLINM